MSKNPGKAINSGKRRPTTRKSGFKSSPLATGKEFKTEITKTYKIDREDPLVVKFDVPQSKGKFSGFGAWFLCNESVVITSKCDQNIKLNLSDFYDPNWGKIGSVWKSESNYSTQIEVAFQSKSEAYIYLYGPNCGVIEHRYLTDAAENRPGLMANMNVYAPEALFLKKNGKVETNKPELKTKSGSSQIIYLKSCNRCARYLPINVHNEREHLSFSNHCVAPHRVPCTHSGFGKLENVDTKSTLELEFGYQLECRFCKKFEVNAAHNPQRNASQMKEDGARRRNFELLLSELYGGSPQLNFRLENNGLELTDYIWNKFNGTCFKCKQKITSKAKMHLDHTRPLALLWPLDGTATCLCGSCNSKKRDRSPSEFYNYGELIELADLTGIPLEEIKKPGPNIAAIKLLENRIDWFFDIFLKRAELVKVRDGKTAGFLLVKALEKAIYASGLKNLNLSEKIKIQQN